MQTLSLSITPAQTAAWRKQIFQQLTERTKRELENFRHYEQAVEQVGRPWTHFVQQAFIECLLYTSPEVRWEKQTDGCVHPSRMSSHPFQVLVDSRMKKGAHSIIHPS